jgi:hypothetical protein
MSRELFISGMLRSGTSLAQAIITSHPQATVVYQPFHQFHVDVKRAYLGDLGVGAQLPLDDGTSGRERERAGFSEWLGLRRFTKGEASDLFAAAATGKGGSMANLDMPTPRSGTFLELREMLLHALWARFPNAGRTAYLGTKEILCEEFVPFLAGSGVDCVLVLRDPRAVVASAGQGRYRESVGDRYPVMMMLRLWRKSAAWWLRLRAKPRVVCLRYEDLALDTDATLAMLAERLGIAPFPPRFGAAGLRDHDGKPWTGNSSHADFSGIGDEPVERWRSRLGTAESRFIAACCRAELVATGYAIPGDLGIADIAGFSEDEQGVRSAYLEHHRLDAETRAAEAERFTALNDSDNAALLAMLHHQFPA